jgi:hypothetical protein
MKDEALSPAIFLMEQVRISTGSPAQGEAIRAAVVPLLQVADQVHAWEAETTSATQEQFSLPEADDRVVAWLTLPPDTFSSRLLKLAGVKRPTAKLLEEAAAFHGKCRSRQVELLTRQLELEKKLAVLVEDAYGLTPEERQLLRATRPVRDPLDVLEAKIRGQAQEVPEQE